MHETTTFADSVQQVLSRVRSLVHRRVRDATRRFWVEGVRPFVQAFDAHVTFDTIVYSRVLLKSDLAEMLVRRLGACGVRRVAVTPEQFRSVCTTERASGIGAIAHQRWTPLGDAAERQGLCLLVIEDIRSSGNLGTILRTAEATGVGGVVFLTPRIDPYDPTTIRSSMGGGVHLQLIRSDHQRLRRWADANRVRLVGLSPDAPRLWTDLPADVQRIALLVGEERHGLSDAGRHICHDLVRLPMTGHADSLNVGVATGVMLYELVRRAHARDGAPTLSAGRE
jgi:TrmH family RNA methyltransferase